MSDGSELYDSRYRSAINDERTFLETPCTSLAGSLIARITATISAISSALIIVMVLRSSQRLSITYHRIMFGMSIADIVASVAMALTTLPMPEDMIYTQFEGKHIGSTLSCNIQSISVNYGSFLTLLYNVMLCVHFNLSIRRKVKNGRMPKRLEVILHLSCFAIPIIIFFAVSNNTNAHNPTPLIPWCTGSPYPYWCTGRSAGREGCLLREIFYRRRATITAIGTLFYGGGDLIVIVLLISIMCRTSQGIPRQHGQSDGRNGNKDEKEPGLLRVVRLQSFAYVIALVIPHSAIIVRVIATMTSPLSNGSMLYYMIARPSQGCFNLIVFVGDKVHNYRVNKQDISITKAILHALTKPIQPNFVFSDMSLLQDENVKSQVNEAQKFQCKQGLDQFPIGVTASDALSYPSRLSSDPSAGLSFCAELKSISHHDHSKNATNANTTASRLDDGPVHQKKLFYKNVRDAFLSEKRLSNSQENEK